MAKYHSRPSAQYRYEHPITADRGTGCSRITMLIRLWRRTTYRARAGLAVTGQSARATYR